jgi:hypothetical protein
MPRTLARTEYCRKQAAECAAAAMAATIADVKEAYVNLEQAWLHLAPEIDQARPFSLVCESSTGSEEQSSERTD